jgi:mRNA interferase RelE/StbE
MTYELDFTPKALKEWKKLGETVRFEFKKKLLETIKSPRVLKNKISGYQNTYKIKLRTSGYRLIYEVKDSQLLILVIAVGKRDKDFVYRQMDNYYS